MLDSIVKNIGTPYTLFFGKNLYQTFMEAYTIVDNNTRKKMEEMLKTWKEPVPGSIDKTPVFPADVVRPIENALIKARTSALQAEHGQMRSQLQLFNRGGRPGAPYRQTPTPPNVRAPFSQPTYPGMNGHRPDSAIGQQSYPQSLVRFEWCIFSNTSTDRCSSLSPTPDQHHSRPLLLLRVLFLSTHHRLRVMVLLLLSLE